MKLTTRYLVIALSIVTVTCLTLGSVMLIVAAGHVATGWERQSKVLTRAMGDAADENPQAYLDRMVTPGSDVIAMTIYDTNTGQTFTKAQNGDVSELPDTAQLEDLANSEVPLVEDLTNLTDDRALMVGKYPESGLLLAAQLSTKPLLQDLWDLWVAATITTFGLAALAGVITTLATRRMASPMVAMSQATAELEAGHFRPETLAKVASRDDEMGHLARSFAQMATEVQQRQDILAQRVAALEVQIDQVERRRSVDQITGSDSFQSLASRARAMRERRAGQERAGGHSGLPDPAAAGDSPKPPRPEPPTDDVPDVESSPHV